MAKELVVVNGVTFERSKIVREKKVIGYGHMPVVPETVTTEDDYAIWLADTVGSGVFTWKQVVEQGLYNIFLKQSAKVGTDYANKNGTNPPKKLDMADLVAAYAFREEAIKVASPNTDPGVVTETMIRLWWQSKRTATGEWDAEQHVTFPKDVR